MKQVLNDEQTLAVNEFETDLLVTAGAGTGKTSVLTNKYLRLLEERRATVNGIVAITFTKKAAAEMRNRIQQGIRERLDEAQDLQDIEFWQQQLLKMESARISTFHSFCLALLREHPLEVKIPPVTGILNEGEETIYLNQAIEEVLLEIFQDSTTDKPLLTRMILDFGWASFVTHLREIYQKVRESGRDFHELIGASSVALEAAIRNVTDQIDHLVDEIDDLLQFCSTLTLTANAKEIIGLFHRKWPDQKAVLVNANSLSLLLSTLTEIRKGLPKTVPQLIKDRVVAIHQLIEKLMYKYTDQESLSRLVILELLFTRMDQVYRDLKLKLAVLDFSDQLLLARDLLRSQPDLAERTRRDIQYLLVDEFQDTNRLQMEIVDLLIGDGYIQGRLMAVGDVKQSIYRFRGAEAGIITGLAQRFYQKGAKVIPLTRNYRSAGKIIDFANRFFQQLFLDEPFSFEPLEAALNIPNADVEMVLTGSQDRRNEAWILAQRIRQLVAENDSKLSYGDIVILFRASTAMHIYQAALRKLDIPYYTASGGGFYHRPEVMDQLNLLRLVEQKYQGIALLGLLNSPYVDLSHDSLLWLSQGRDLIKHFYEMENFSEYISTAEQNRLSKFRSLILYLQENRENLNIPNIIRIALENSNYREMLWSSPNAGQSLANLDKLLEKADEFTSKGFRDLRFFIEFIEQLNEVEVLEGEAPTQAENSNAVRLMTIHRAKGLEFPVVIIPDLDRQFLLSSQGKLAFHPSVGLGLRIAYGEGESNASSLWEKIKETDKREELSEFKRVLYVALTRAKQQLILIGSGCNRSKGTTVLTANNWMKWFELILPLETDDLILDFQGVQVKINREVPETPPPVPKKNLIDSIWPELNRESEPEILATQEVAATRWLEMPKIRSYQVSELVTCHECSRRYFWQYRAGFEGALFSSSTPESEGRMNLGTRIGSFIHQAFQSADSNWPEMLWQEHFQDFSPSMKEQIKPEMIRMWQNFRQSRFMELHKNYWDEVPFLFKLTEDIRIEGRIDRLSQLENDELILVDYKTHRVQAQEAMVLAEKYFWQLQLYALAIRSFWGKVPVQAAIYFPFSNQTVQAPLDEHSLAQTQQQVISMIHFVEEHERVEDFPRGEACSHCNFNYLCQM